MTDYKSIYKDKVKSVEEALKKIRDNDIIFVAQAGAEPMPLLEKLHLLKDYGTKNVEVQNCLPIGNYEFINNPAYKENIFTQAIMKKVVAKFVFIQI